MPVTHQPVTDHALDSARARRISVKQALSEVEIAAAAPSASPDWRLELDEALGNLRMAFEQHVVDVEAPDGLISEIIATAPRLSPKADRLRDEHATLTALIDNLVAAARMATAASELRNEILDVLVAIARHRQLGADLVYEAYEVDIGGQS